MCLSAGSKPDQSHAGVSSPEGSVTNRRGARSGGRMCGMRRTPQLRRETAGDGWVLLQGRLLTGIQLCLVECCPFVAVDDFSRLVAMLSDV